MPLPLKINIKAPMYNKRLQQLSALATYVPIAAKQSTLQFARDVLKDSRTIPPTVPVDTGDLKSTGRVESTPKGHAVVYGGKRGTGKGPRGGKFVDYANPVHDRMDANVNWKRPGSGPKFVEAHFRQRAKELPADVRKIFRQVVKQVFG